MYLFYGSITAILSFLATWYIAYLIKKAFKRKIFAWIFAIPVLFIISQIFVLTYSEPVLIIGLVLGSGLNLFILKWLKKI